MGYRCNVGIALSKKDYESLIAEINSLDNKMLKDSLLNLLTKDQYHKKIEIDDNYIGLYFEGIKSSYEGLAYLERFLKDKKHDKIIVGEDYTDTEIYFGTDEYLIDLRREIVFG